MLTDSRPDQRHEVRRNTPPLPDRIGQPITTDTYVGRYQPIYYAITGLPLRVLPPTSGVYGARLANVVLCAALIASAVASSRGLGPITSRAVLLAVTPAAVFMISTLNPQGIEIVAALGLWSTGLLLLRSPSIDRRVVLRRGVSAGALCSARPTGPVLAALIIAVILGVAADRANLSQLWRRRSVRWVTSAGAAIWLANLVFVLVQGSTSAVIRYDRPDGLTREIWDGVVDRLPTTMTDQVSLISWHGFLTLNLPGPMVTAWLALIAGLVAVGLWTGDLRIRIGLVALVGAWAVAPMAAAVYDPGVSWQGRYALPAAVGIPILAAWSIDRSSGERRNTAGAIFMNITALVTATCIVVAQSVLMGRNLHGQPSAIFAPLDARLWNGPLTPKVLFAASLAAAVTTVVLATTPTFRSRNGSGTAALSPGD